MDDVLEFITVFCDRCHHEKEEGLLFPALTSTGCPKLSGPITVMLSEHAHAQALVKEMVESWRRHRTGDKAAARNFTEAANRYNQLLTAHIQKENGLLFPIAERALSAETEQKLLNEFERFEVEKIGRKARAALPDARQPASELFDIKPARCFGRYKMCRTAESVPR